MAWLVKPRPGEGPVETGSAGSVAEISGGQLRRLAAGTGLAAQADLAVRVLHEMTTPWNTRAAADLPPSDVSADGSPVEFAAGIGGCDPSVQFAVEPMTADPGPDARARAARAVMARLAHRGWATAERWSAVADLFLCQEATGPHLAMYGAEFSGAGLAGCKVWFYPGCTGGDRAPALVREALGRVRLPGAWAAVVRHARGDFSGCRPILFSLDLSDRPTARTKIYFRHYGVRPDDLSALLADHGFDAGETSAFCRLATGGGTAFSRQPPVTCLSFTAPGGRPDAATLYVPLWVSAPDDATVQRRTHRVLSRLGVSPVLYDRCLAAVARRPLADALGLHNYLALRSGPVRHRVKCYWSPELRHTDPLPRYRTTALPGTAHAGPVPQVPQVPRGLVRERRWSGP
ncbi:conserved hypothetical protein [Streptomyces clavuligerus]|nr:conserved hypothetical protein [Streptomyces clavuligerus]